MKFNDLIAHVQHRIITSPLELQRIGYKKDDSDNSSGKTCSDVAEYELNMDEDKDRFMGMHGIVEMQENECTENSNLEPNDDYVPMMQDALMLMETKSLHFKTWIQMLQEMKNVCGRSDERGHG